MSEKQYERYRQIVDHVARLARELPGESIRIQDLCTTARISQRMLRRAFHHVHGLAPYRFIRRLRMNEAMKALAFPASSTATVTQVATEFGFLELGRFAVEYRSMFGETPSATLRRALASKSSSNVPRLGRSPLGIVDRARSANGHEGRVAP